MPTPLLRRSLWALAAAGLVVLVVLALPFLASTRLVRDRIAHERLAYLEQPAPHFLTYGPKTRREFLRLPGAGEP